MAYPHIIALGDRVMKKQTLKTYVFWIALSEAVGILSGLLSRSGMMEFGEAVLQPPLSPPAIVFPIVWTILYALMGISAARVFLSDHSAERSFGLHLFCSQLAVNFFWSIIFFNIRNFGLAFLWLLLLIILVAKMIKDFAQIDLTAAKLQIPYLLWCIFAAALNFGVWWLNR